MDELTLQRALVWLLQQGGAAWVAYWLIEHIKPLVELQAEIKRYVSWGIAGLLAVGGYMLTIAIGVNVAPVGTVPWINALLGVVATAIIGGQMIHGAAQLRKKPRQVLAEDNFFVS